MPLRTADAVPTCAEAKGRQGEDEGDNGKTDETHDPKRVLHFPAPSCGVIRKGCANWTGQDQQRAEPLSIVSF